MNNFEYLKSLSLDELAAWLDKYGQFEESAWMTWFGENYCENCEPIKCQYFDSDHEFLCSYCELEKHCKFFPELKEAPDNLEIIKLWLKLSYNEEKK